MTKSGFELYHEQEILDIPTNGINTTPNSPTEKFMRGIDQVIYDHVQNIQSITILNDINQAVGGQLDDIGDDYDLPRMGRDDNLYRFLLKLRVANRTSQGTPNEVIAIIAATFNVDPHDVQVQNDYVLDENEKPSGNPLHVRVENLPLDEIEHPEITELFIEELQNALALGITISDVSFTIDAKIDAYVGTAFANYFGLAVSIDNSIINYGNFDIDSYTGVGTRLEIDTEI